MWWPCRWELGISSVKGFSKCFSLVQLDPKFHGRMCYIIVSLPGHPLCGNGTALKPDMIIPEYILNITVLVCPQESHLLYFNRGVTASIKWGLIVLRVCQCMHMRWWELHLCMHVRLKSYCYQLQVYLSKQVELNMSGIVHLNLSMPSGRSFQFSLQLLLRELYTGWH